jgi:predicted PurR-regulated permease PerM
MNICTLTAFFTCIISNWSYDYYAKLLVKDVLMLSLLTSFDIVIIFLFIIYLCIPWRRLYSQNIGILKGSLKTFSWLLILYYLKILRRKFYVSLPTEKSQVRINRCAGDLNSFVTSNTEKLVIVVVVVFLFLFFLTDTFYTKLPLVWPKNQHNMK